MKRKKILPYNPILKELARELREGIKMTKDIPHSTLERPFLLRLLRAFRTPNSKDLRHKT
jgi:hypothetical protein